MIKAVKLKGRLFRSSRLQHASILMDAIEHFAPGDAERGVLTAAIDAGTEPVEFGEIIGGKFETYEDWARRLGPMAR